MMWSEQQYDEFTALLMSKYPAMFPDRCCIETDAGWWPIIEALCGNIQRHTDWPGRPVVEQVVVEQIKEKFGGLRFYYSGGDEKIAGMVQMAESWAARACERCGAPGVSRPGGWVRTLCDAHNQEREQR